MPWHVEMQDVLAFLSRLPDLRPEQVNLLGSVRGDSFVHLGSQEEMDRALRHDHDYMSKRYIEVQMASKAEEQVRMQEVGIGPATRDCHYEGIVLVRKLPLDADEALVYEYVNADHVVRDGLHIIEPQKDDAFVVAYCIMGSEAQARIALRKNKDHKAMGSVHINTTSKVELYSVVNEGRSHFSMPGMIPRSVFTRPVAIMLQGLPEDCHPASLAADMVEHVPALREHIPAWRVFFLSGRHALPQYGMPCALVHQRFRYHDGRAIIVLRDHADVHDAIADPATQTALQGGVPVTSLARDAKIQTVCRAHIATGVDTFRAIGCSAYLLMQDDSGGRRDIVRVSNVPTSAMAQDVARAVQAAAGDVAESGSGSSNSNAPCAFMVLQGGQLPGYDQSPNTSSASSSSSFSSSAANHKSGDAVDAAQDEADGASRENATSGEATSSNNSSGQNWGHREEGPESGTAASAADVLVEMPSTIAATQSVDACGGALDVLGRRVSVRQATRAELYFSFPLSVWSVPSDDARQDDGDDEGDDGDHARTTSNTVSDAATFVPELQTCMKLLHVSPHTSDEEVYEHFKDLNVTGISFPDVDSTVVDQCSGFVEFATVRDMLYATARHRTAFRAFCLEVVPYSRNVAAQEIEAALAQHSGAISGRRDRGSSDKKKGARNRANAFTTSTWRNNGQRIFSDQNRRGRDARDGDNQAPWARRGQRAHNGGRRQPVYNEDNATPYTRQPRREGRCQAGAGDRKHKRERAHRHGYYETGREDGPRRVGPGFGRGHGCDTAGEQEWLPHDRAHGSHDTGHSRAALYEEDPYAPRRYDDDERVERGQRSECDTRPVYSYPPLEVGRAYDCATRYQQPGDDAYYRSGPDRRRSRDEYEARGSQYDDCGAPAAAPTREHGSEHEHAERPRQRSRYHEPGQHAHETARRADSYQGRDGGRDGSGPPRGDRPSLYDGAAVERRYSMGEGSDRHGSGGGWEEPERQKDRHHDAQHRPKRHDEGDHPRYDHRSQREQLQYQHQDLGHGRQHHRQHSHSHRHRDAQPTGRDGTKAGSSYATAASAADAALAAAPDFQYSQEAYADHASTTHSRHYEDRERHTAREGRHGHGTQRLSRENVERVEREAFHR